MKNKRLEMALRNKIRGIVLEIQLEREFVNGLVLLESDMVRVCRNTKSPVNEGLSSIIGLWLSGPYIVKLFGKFIAFMDTVVKKFNKTGFGGDKLAEKILEFAEQYHHKVMWIFEKVAGKFTKEEDTKKTIANLLFTITIGSLLGHAVGDIASTVSSGTFNSTVIAKAAKAAVKGRELYDGVKDAFKLFIPTITKIASVT